MNQALLEETVRLATTFLESLPARPVRAPASMAQLLEALGGPLPEAGTAPQEVIEALVRGADAGLVASAGPRYFGFVIGGSLPVALAADWLTSTWDQNAARYVMSPAAAAVESVTARWLLDVLGLPAGASVGFVSGTQLANFTCLAAARHEVLRRCGWNVEEDGLQGAPPVTVVASAESHVTVFTALRMLGLGAKRALVVETDAQGRMRADALRSTLQACNGPTIICAQAGNVNTGACDPCTDIAALAAEHQAWLHIDGAFGLWAAVSPETQDLVAGVERADSWATDAHKWLNVPYDSGLAITKHPAAHAAAMKSSAAYLIAGQGGERDGADWTPDASRRARGFPLYAALRFLGRRGLRDLVERCCRRARQMAERLRGAPQVQILNDVVLNQVLVHFRSAQGGDGDAFTRAVIARVQNDGTCWLGGTTWHGVAAMRIAISNWSTAEADVERSAAAILRAVGEEAGG
jgi:glutamate/tyrosine decarboxylase-like PLP-dependent enzyme